MKKALLVTCLSLWLGFFVAACATAPESAALSNEKNLALQPKIVIGSSFDFQSTDLVTGEITFSTWLVEKQAPYRGKPAYWVRVVRVKIGESELSDDFLIKYLLFDLKFNWMAFLSNEFEVRGAYPSIPKYKWPLRVGDTWKGKFKFQRMGQKKRTIINEFRVEGLEEVEVPAGTFHAFKVVRTSPVLKETYWYVPEIGIAVKEEFNFYFRKTGGVTRKLKELTGYNIP